MPTRLSHVLSHALAHGKEIARSPRVSPASTLTIPREAAIAWAMTGEMEDIANLSFEDALRALETIVRQLESGEVPLEDSISLYERGDRLRQHCQKRLDAAQARIERIVTGPDGTPAGTQPFDAPDR